MGSFLIVPVCAWETLAFLEKVFGQTRQCGAHFGVNAALKVERVLPARDGPSSRLHSHPHHGSGATPHTFLDVPSRSATVPFPPAHPPTQQFVKAGGIRAFDAPQRSQHTLVSAPSARSCSQLAFSFHTTKRF